MRRWVSASVLALIAIGGGCAGADLSRECPHTKGLSLAYQRAVGGLGLGPAQSLGTCPAAFDARLARTCASDVGRFPGGASFCIGHAGIGAPHIYLRPAQ